MAMVQRRKERILILALYWPTMFVLTHIPMPEVVRNARVSDKSLHVLVYMILVFLLWSALKPTEKANWRRAVTWAVLLVALAYAMCDEYLQRFVAGRSPDAKDFLADAVGAIAGLAVVAIFSFWPASLVVAGTTIYTLAVFTRANLTRLLPVTTTVLNFTAYGVFTLLWIGYLANVSSRKKTGGKWLAASLSAPGALLVVTKISTLASGKEFEGWDIVAAVAGILGVVAAVSAVRLAWQRNVKGIELSEAEA